MLPWFRYATNNAEVDKDGPMHKPCWNEERKDRECRKKDGE